MGAKHVVSDPRLEFTRRLMKYFARVDVRDVLTVRSESGDRPFLAVFKEDRVSEVCAKVAVTGSSNVCVEHDGGLAILGFVPGFGESVIEAHVQDVHQDITIGMLLDFVTGTQKRGQEIPLRIDLGKTQGRVPSMQVLEYAS